VQPRGCEAERCELQARAVMVHPGCSLTEPGPITEREGRTYFLSHYAKFSSPAALSFGLREIVNDQLSKLQER